LAVTLWSKCKGPLSHPKAKRRHARDRGDKGPLKVIDTIAFAITYIYIYIYNTYIYIRICYVVIIIGLHFVWITSTPCLNIHRLVRGGLRCQCGASRPEASKHLGAPIPFTCSLVICGQSSHICFFLQETKSPEVS